MKSIAKDFERQAQPMNEQWFADHSPSSADIYDVCNSVALILQGYYHMDHETRTIILAAGAAGDDDETASLIIASLKRRFALQKISKNLTAANKEGASI